MLEKTGRGFTLIELLVVIAIISLLSSVVLASLNSARLKAQTSKAKTELSQFVKVAIVAQGESGKRLQDITGSGCSRCSCGAGDLRNILTSDPCYVAWLNVLTTIQGATAGIVTGLTQMTRDTWGSPYMLDENEREFGPTYCVKDSIWSVGPDGVSGNADDIGYNVPFSRDCP